MLKDNLPKRITALLLFFITIVPVSFVLTGCRSKEPIPASYVESVDDLEYASIGVQLGTIGDIYITDDYPEADIQHFNKGADAIQALKQGKVDCVVIDQMPAEAFAKKNKDISILDEEFTDEDYALCIAKENSELTGKINDALKELKENGVMESIISNYIGDATIGSYQYESLANTDRSNGIIIMATNATFEPYEYILDGRIVGIDADLAQAIADILCMELVIEDMEFDSIISAVQSGKADFGMAGLTVTEDRLKNVDFSDSYTTSTQVIVVRNGLHASSASLMERLKETFIVEARWKYIVNGLLTTLKISLFAVIVGVVIGVAFAIVRATCDKTGSLKIFNWLIKVYVTIIRGTPVMIQLLIIYYVIFSSVNVDKVLVAVIAFGLNSSAYMTEIVRSGIMSVDNGQFEAGRSLGFNYIKTMRYFILPQAFKNILPAIGNELIVLIKETSIAGYIGIMDLTRAGDYIRSRTYDAFLPLFVVALIYLIIVLILTSLVSRLERRMSNGGK